MLYIKTETQKVELLERRRKKQNAMYLNEDLSLYFGRDHILSVRTRLRTSRYEKDTTLLIYLG